MTPSKDIISLPPSEPDRIPGRNGGGYWNGDLGWWLIKMWVSELNIIEEKVAMFDHASVDCNPR